jgi:hypothetical protein
MEGILEWMESNGGKKRQQEYVNRMSSIIQTKVLGTVTAPSQWRFLLTEEGNMGALEMDNNRTRSMINEIELIIEGSFPDSDDNKQRLLCCFPQYRADVIILRKNTDLTEEEIATFQDHINAWFCDWVKVYGKEGCTNYTHMLSSGHVMQYMQEWKCLNRYSQQGWEALNALMKSYSFRQTNLGGLSKKLQRRADSLALLGGCNEELCGTVAMGTIFLKMMTTAPIMKRAVMMKVVLKGGMMKQLLILTRTLNWQVK